MNQKVEPIRLQVKGRETRVKLSPSAKEQAISSLGEFIMLGLELVCGIAAIAGFVGALWAWLS